MGLNWGDKRKHVHPQPQDVAAIINISFSKIPSTKSFRENKKEHKKETNSKAWLSLKLSPAPYRLKYECVLKMELCFFCFFPTPMLIVITSSLIRKVCVSLGADSRGDLATFNPSPNL